MKYAWGHKLLSILLAVALLFSMTACSSSDPVLITCNGLSITQSTFLLLMTEQATQLLGQEGITEENVVEKAKEAVLQYLPAYTYYKQGYTNAGYTLSEEDSGSLRAAALSMLLDRGLEYEVEREDDIFLETFGVTFEQYMDYQEESYLISYFYNTELEKVEIDETLLQQYFAQHQAEYAICTADIVRIPLKDGAETTAKTVFDLLQNGASTADCKKQLGDALDKTETLTFDNTANLDTAFGEGFVQQMVTAAQGDIITLETEQSITLARLNKLSGYTENLETIKDVFQEEVYAEALANTINTEAYTPQIVNQEAYDAIREIPGSDVL